MIGGHEPISALSVLRRAAQALAERKWRDEADLRKCQGFPGPKPSVQLDDARSRLPGK